MLTASPSKECCAAVGGIGVHRRERVGVWRTGRPTGEGRALGHMCPPCQANAVGIPASCDYEGGAYWHEGEETLAEYEARADQCARATMAEVEAGEAWDFQVGRFGTELLDDVLDRVFGDDDKRGPTVGGGLTTGEKIGIGVGIAAIVVTVTTAVIVSRGRKKAA